jgi:hypothetical protein
MRTKTLLFSHTERNVCFTRHSISFVELSISIFEEHRRTSKNIEEHGADAASQADVPCHCGLHTRSSASDAARNLAEILGCRSVQIGADRFNDLMFLPICAGSPIF